MRLIDKAKATKVRKGNAKDITSEDVELAIAWVRDEVTYSQVCSAYDLKKGSASVYSKLARSLKEGFRDETFIIKG